MRDVSYDSINWVFDLDQVWYSEKNLYISKKKIKQIALFQSQPQLNHDNNSPPLS